MTTADLKLKLFRQIDGLEKNRLEELSGVVTNYINGQKDIDDWDDLENLTEGQKKGIIEALEQLDAGKGIPHEEVMTRIRKKYPNA